MNFLAHFHLSFDDPDLMIGNFIADGLRGKEHLSFTPPVQLGVKLHRFIDAYTDRHTEVKKAVKLLKATQGRYATVIVDIMFDHFLAKNWSQFHTENLLPYTEFVYATLDSRFSELPAKYQKMLPYMKKDNWLYQYQNFYGMQQAFSGIARRASFKSNMANGIEDLSKYYEELNELFLKFYPDLIEKSMNFKDDNNIKF